MGRPFLWNREDTIMIGTITSLLVGYWFYQSAHKVEKNPFKWLAVGMIFYYGARIVWTYAIIRPLMGQSFYQHSMMTGAIIESTAIAVGVVLVALIHRRFLVSKRG